MNCPFASAPVRDILPLPRLPVIVPTSSIEPGAAGTFRDLPWMLSSRRLRLPAGRVAFHSW